MEYNLVTNIRLLDSIKEHRNKDALARMFTVKTAGKCLCIKKIIIKNK